MTNIWWQMKEKKKEKKRRYDLFVCVVWIMRKTASICKTHKTHVYKFSCIFSWILTVRFFSSKTVWQTDKSPARGIMMIQLVFFASSFTWQVKTQKTDRQSDLPEVQWWYSECSVPAPSPDRWKHIKPTNRQTDSNTDRQTDRQTDRPTVSPARGIMMTQRMLCASYCAWQVKTQYRQTDRQLDRQTVSPARGIMMIQQALCANSFTWQVKTHKTDRQTVSPARGIMMMQRALCASSFTRGRWEQREAASTMA